MIKDARQRAGVTQATLAAQIGVAQQQIAKWESGTTFPSADRLPQIAQVLSCTIDDLFSDVSVSEISLPDPTP